MEHAFHVSVKHFTAALDILSLEKTKCRIHGTSSSKTAEVKTMMLRPVWTLRPQLMTQRLFLILLLSILQLGKVLAFVNQICLCGEDTQKYLTILCTTNGCKPLKIKLWVRTHWGSVADCFGRVLELCKV